MSTFHVNHLPGNSLNINLCKRLILKALSKSVAEDILNFFYNFSVFLKIRLGISCECSASLTLSEKYEEKKIKMSAAGVVSSLTLRIHGKIFSRRHIEVFFLFFPRK